jgi:drug/metabolite transporter (DMT)-like permease
MTGTSDFLAGTKSRSLGPQTVVTVSQLVALAPALALVTMLGQGVSHWPYLLGAVGAGLAAGLSLMASYRALVIAQMALVMPILATAAVIPFLFGVATGEHPAAGQVLGVCLALIGLVVVVSPPRAERRAGTRLAAGAGLAALGAIGGGGYLIGIDLGRRAGFIPDIVTYRIVIAGLLTGIALALPAQRGRIKFRLDLPIVAIGILEFSTVFVYATALSRGILSLVAVVSSLYPVTTLVLAGIVLHERPSRSQLIGVVAVLAGVALIAGT